MHRWAQLAPCFSNPAAHPPLNHLLRRSSALRNPEHSTQAADSVAAADGCVDGAILQIVASLANPVQPLDRENSDDAVSGCTGADGRIRARSAALCAGASPPVHEMPPAVSVFTQVERQAMVRAEWFSRWTCLLPWIRGC